MDIDTIPDGSLGQAQIKKLLRDAEVRLKGSGSGSEDPSIISPALSKIVDGNLPIR